MPEALDILGLKINPLTMQETIDLIMDKISEEEYGCSAVFTPNAEIVMQARNNEKFRQILNESWLNLPDGAGLQLAAKILPHTSSLPARVAGCDLLENLLEISADRNFSVYFLGAKPGVAAEAAHKAQKKTSQVNISGCHHGYLHKTDIENLIQQINNRQPDILFVGMGAPRQEKFIYFNQEELNVKVAVTVGGSFDVLAGNVNRAPRIIQKLYLEWFYRLLQEPKRWRRISRLPRFMGLVMSERLKQVLKNDFRVII